MVHGLDNPLTASLAPFGTPLYQTTHDNFAHRVGAAFRISQRQGRETVLRGGFGIFYDLGNAQASQAFATGFPFLVSATFANVLFPLTPAP